MGQAMEVADVKADAAAAAHGGADCPAPSRRPYLGLSGVLLAALQVAAEIPAALLGWRQTGLPGLEAPDKYLYDLHQVWLAKQEQTARPELALIAIRSARSPTMPRSNLSIGDCSPNSLCWPKLVHPSSD